MMINAKKALKGRAFKAQGIALGPVSGQIT